MPLTCDQENQIFAALGALVAQQLIDWLNAQGSAGPVVLPLINHTQPMYIADTNYTDTIDDMLVTYLIIVAMITFGK